MRKVIIAIVALSILTSAAYQKAIPGGSWTFKSNHATANMFLPHGYSLAALDTTKNPQPKFIIDFHSKLPASNGKYTVVHGSPKTEDEVSIGTGISQGGAVTFYSSTGGNGKQVVNVTVASGRITMSGSAIEMAAQANAKDIAPLTFNISILQ